MGLPFSDRCTASRFGWLNVLPIFVHTYIRHAHITNMLWMYVWVVIVGVDPKTLKNFLLQVRHTVVRGADLTSKQSATDSAAPVERFFSTLKTEVPELARSTSRRRARASLFEYIETYYNRERMHSTLDYMTPAEYEAAA